MRSGKEVDILAKVASRSSNQEKEKNIPIDDDESKFLSFFYYKPTPLFPHVWEKSRKDKKNKDLYKTFCRCKVSIPLLDAIKRVPCYAKFLKELCTSNKNQKLKVCEKLRVKENMSTIIQKQFPTKCNDPSTFTIPCTIGSTRFEIAMIDLGVVIKVMSYSIYAYLKLGPLNKTDVVIQFVDRSIVYSKGIMEDIIVKVNDLVFTTDFYVFDMEHGDQTALILLGRPFLKTSKTKINVCSGTLTM